MPPRKRGRRAGDPCRDAIPSDRDERPGGSDGEEAGPGPSSQTAGLLDVLDAVLAHGRHARGSRPRHALRSLCRRARDAVDGAIAELDLHRFQEQEPRQLTPDEQAGLIRLMGRLPGLRRMSAHWDAELLSKVAAARAGMLPMRTMRLFLPYQCTALGHELGAVLAAFPGLEVRVRGAALAMLRAMLPVHCAPNACMAQST
jgi:hypothetical protein